VPVKVRAKLSAAGIGVFLFALLAAAPMFARHASATEPVFGPQKYVRTTGAPDEFTADFTIPADLQGPFVLRIVNGEPGARHRVTAATVYLNGRLILKPSEFSQKRASIERTVTLAATNHLKVTIAGKPDTFITLSVLGTKKPVRNKPPVVGAGPDQTITLPAVASLQGSVSDDGLPKTHKLKIWWEKTTGPGTVTFANPASPVTTASFSTPGKYEICLNADDGQHHTFDHAFIEVLPEPPPPPPNGAPVAKAGGPYKEAVGHAITFDASQSTDPDGDALTYAWDFGDGTKGSGVTTSHAYASAGTFNVTVTVEDGRGGTNAASTTATIAAPPPVNRAPVAVVGGPYKALAGGAVAFDGSGSSDPDGDSLTYAWDFGDGAKGSGVNPTRAYASADTFTITLTVDDGKGATASASTTATISAPPPVNRAPVAMAGGPYKGQTGASVGFDGSKSGDPDGDALTYSWNFGDGGTGTGASPAHVYKTAGTFTVPMAAAARTRPPRPR
jgi:chitodextrinase